MVHTDGRPKEAPQKAYLREQIEMRVLGCGWDKYETRWSSNKNAKIGTVEHLTTLLEEIFVDELARARFPPGTERGLPTEAAPPQHRARAVSQLGTLDPEAAAIRGKALFSTEELRIKAEAARERRIEAGISDPVENMQPVKNPPFDQSLVGKWLEVRGKYKNKDTGEPEYIWSGDARGGRPDGQEEREGPEDPARRRAALGVGGRPRLRGGGGRAVARAPAG